MYYRTLVLLSHVYTRCLFYVVVKYTSCSCKHINWFCGSIGPKKLKKHQSTSPFFPSLVLNTSATLGTLLSPFAASLWINPVVRPVSAPRLLVPTLRPLRSVLVKMMNMGQPPSPEQIHWRHHSQRRSLLWARFMSN